MSHALLLKASSPNHQLGPFLRNQGNHINCHTFFVKLINIRDLHIQLRSLFFKMFVFWYSPDDLEVCLERCWICTILRESLVFKNATSHLYFGCYREKCQTVAYRVGLCFVASAVKPFLFVEGVFGGRDRQVASAVKPSIVLCALGFGGKTDGLCKVRSWGIFP